jgi:hypothetical protein
VENAGRTTGCGRPLAPLFWRGFYVGGFCWTVLMSIQQLRPPVVAGAVAAAQDRVREAAAVPTGSVPTSELGQAIGALSELESQVVALRYALSAESDERGVSELTADTGTDAWLARLTGEPREIMGCGWPRCSRPVVTTHVRRSRPGGGGCRRRR